MSARALCHLMLLGVIIVTLFASGCTSDANFNGVIGIDTNSPGVVQSDSRTARYQYEGFDVQGRRVVRGVMTIMTGDSMEVSGEWRFYATGDPSRIGPQVGSGKLVGAVVANKIWLNLNPRYVDNNVFLTGTGSGRVLLGTWEYVGFPGVLAGGTFRAVQLNVRFNLSE